MNSLSSLSSNTFSNIKSRALAFNTIDPSGLTLYYPFSISTLNADAIRVANMATGSMVYDASLTNISVIEKNSLISYHVGATPTGQHGLVINRTLAVPTSGGMSISFWFVCTSLPRSDYWFLYTVQDTLGFSGGTRFYMTIDTVNKIRVAGQGGNTLVSNTVITVGTRYHVVYNYTSGSGVGDLYINNVLDSSITSGPLIVANNSGFNSILRDPAGNGLIGTIDEFRHYLGRVLSLQQIQTLYSIPPLTHFQQLLIEKPPFGKYNASSWVQGTLTLIDETGNLRHGVGVGAGLNQASASGNGATAVIPYIDGLNTDTMTWAVGTIPANHTICFITRYSSSTLNQERILTSDTQNSVLGHHVGKRGVISVSSQITPFVNTTPTTNWANMCYTNGLSGTNPTPNNVLLNGVGIGNANGGDNVVSRLGINIFTGGEQSRFQISQLLIWDSALTPTEIGIVSASYTRYLLTGILS